MAYTVLPTKATGDIWTAADFNTYWRDNFAAAVPDIMTAKGDIPVATGADAATVLNLGTTGQLLTADSGEASGIKWALDPITDILAAKGDLVVGSGADAIARLAVGTDQYMLIALSGATNGLSWKQSEEDLVTTKGDILVATAANTIARLGVGADGETLRILSGQSEGMHWSSTASDTIYAHYRVGTDRTIPDSTDTIINFDTQIADAGSAVTTGAAWKFTCPSGKDGWYLVKSCVKFNSTSLWNVGEQALLKLYKNGSNVSGNGISTRTLASGANPYTMSLNGGTIVYLAATDYIDIRGHQTSGASLDVDNIAPGSGTVSDIFIAKLAIDLP